MDWSEFEKHLKIEIQNLGGRYVWSDVQLQGGYHIQKNVKNHKYRLLETNDKKPGGETWKEKLKENS